MPTLGKPWKSSIFKIDIKVWKHLNVLLGSGLIESGAGSSISSETGSRSRSRVFKTKYFQKNSWRKIFFLFGSKIAICLSLQGPPSYRRIIQPSKENIQHLKKWSLLTFFLYFVGHFCQSGSGFRDPIESGSTTLVFLKLKTLYIFFARQVPYAKKNDKKTKNTHKKTLVWFKKPVFFQSCLKWVKPVNKRSTYLFNFSLPNLTVLVFQNPLVRGRG